MAPYRPRISAFFLAPRACVQIADAYTRAVPAYNRVFKNLAERAVQQGGIDAETFIKQAIDAGISESRIMQLLEQDLDNAGPIFGKFMRSIVGAAQATITTAGRQGELMGILASDNALKELVGLATGSGESALERVLQSADPDLAAEIEDASADKLEETWVATLVNTCHRCLPLHGQVRTRAEWRELGLTPETIHEGWDSSCQCRLVPSSYIDRSTAMQPLVRVKQQAQGMKRTMRAVTQGDLERAQNEIAKAMQSKQGRSMLRLLGQANSDTEGSDE